MQDKHGELQCGQNAANKKYVLFIYFLQQSMTPGFASILFYRWAKGDTNKLNNLSKVVHLLTESCYCKTTQWIIN